MADQRYCRMFLGLRPDRGRSRNFGGDCSRCAKPCSNEGKMMDPWHWRCHGYENKALRSKRKKPKSVLRLPDLEIARTAVLQSLTSPDSQPATVTPWMSLSIGTVPNPALPSIRRLWSGTGITSSPALAPGTINLRLGAVRPLAYEAADCGLLSSDLVAGIRRVKGVKKHRHAARLLADR
jgi:hypothetical protein